MIYFILKTITLMNTVSFKGTIKLMTTAAERIIVRFYKTSESI